MVTAVATNAADIAISYARAQIGKPYRWAAAGPNAFDCSGLTMAAYRAANVQLPHYTGFQVLKGTAVTKDQLQPGDLVFPDSGHVQLYSGNGMVIEAPHTGTNVREVPMWGFWKARRLVPGGTVTTPTTSNTGAQGFGIPGGAGVLGDALGLDKWINQFMSGARHWTIRLFEVLLGGALIIVGLDKIGAGASAGTVAKLAKYAK